MKVRGKRECRGCGTRWSYYDTGSVTCPECGSIDSRGVEDERTLHTDTPVSLDLAAARNDIDERPLTEVCSDVKSACREYVRRRGFVRGGELLDLDDTYLAASELVHVADIVARSVRLDDESEAYFLKLLGGADAGERPPAEEVPDGLRAARGLGVAGAVRAYRSDVSEWLEENPHPEAERVLELLSHQSKRLRALEGDVPPREAETLVRATRDLHDSLAGDESALATARERLASLE